MKFLSRFRPPVLLLVTLSLTGLVASILVGVSFLEVVPDADSETRLRRQQLCETSAIAFSLMAQRANSAVMEEYLNAIADRGKDVVSIGVRTSGGELVVQCGDHAANWDPECGDDSQVSVNLYAEAGLWGEFEAKFTSAGAGTLITPYASLDHLLIVASICLVGFYFYLRVVLRQLNPSNVIPHRVRDALDTLAEGLILVDVNERIVLANRSFEASAGTDRDALIGNSIDRLPLVSQDETASELTPWRDAIDNGASVRGRLFGLRSAGHEATTYSVSVSPILDEKGRSRGALATFEDVSRLEQKKKELANVVASLQVSTEEIKAQNRELERLATRDPLTGCFNRRSFFDRFEAEWKSAARYGQPLTVMMVDIDFFKSINDNHGHSAGDEVLRQVGGLLTSIARETDVVCRYGGEEFAILLSNTDADSAAVLAERIRVQMTDLEFGKFSITASLGVSEKNDAAESPQDLLDQADKCLYVAKRGGRNRVVCWHEVPKDLVVDESSISRTREVEDDSTAVPYHAVTALLSALAYRDESTASHSRRVADLCVSMGEGLLSLRNCYTLEIAALLHDVGKVGVPDHILLKPGALTDDEWAVMRRHDKIGKEIIRASFASAKLTEIVESYQKQYKASDGTFLTMRELPVEARILAVADAYDSMTSPRVYRERMTQADAFAELRSCAGDQFDPEMVERLISTVARIARNDEEAAAPMPKETALAIGLQIERLSEALDARDQESIRAVSKRLEMTARKYEATPIIETATKMSHVLESDSDLFSVLESANQLLRVCRRSQRAFARAEIVDASIHS